MSLQFEPIPTAPASANIEHIFCLSEDFLQLHNSEEYSDLTLIVAGKRFHAHKIVLAARSQYFRGLLFGGLMDEGSEKEIELKTEASVSAFKDLLKYIYTGRISLADWKEEVVLDILKLASLYGFHELESLILDYLREILNIGNICSIYDAALFDRFQFLTNDCLEFMDKHAAAIIEHDSFLQLSCSAVNKLISRVSFRAPDIKIFLAVKKWLGANPDADKESLLSRVQLSMIPTDELLDIVRPSGLVSSEAILDAIAAARHIRDLNLKYKLLVNENMADPKYGAIMLQGEILSCSLLDTPKTVYRNNKESVYAQHTITKSSKRGIVIKLGAQCFINHITMSLWGKNGRSYSYYIEVSIDQNEWTRVIDHQEYYCHSWQDLYFKPRVVLYIRIVGTHSTLGNSLHVRSFEAYYTNHDQIIKNGLVVASIYTCVSYDLRCGNRVCDGDDESGRYMSHTLGTGSILLQFYQPYIIGSMELRLPERNDSSYSYYIEVSSNLRDWTVVADKRGESCKGWQIIKFPLRTVVFVRIVGTYSAVNNEFRCGYFQCPADQDDTESS